MLEETNSVAVCNETLMEKDGQKFDHMIELLSGAVHRLEDSVRPFSIGLDRINGSEETECIHRMSNYRQMVYNNIDKVLTLVEKINDITNSIDHGH